MVSLKEHISVRIKMTVFKVNPPPRTQKTTFWIRYYSKTYLRAIVVIGDTVITQLGLAEKQQF